MCIHQHSILSNSVANKSISFEEDIDKYKNKGNDIIL